MTKRGALFSNIFGTRENSHVIEKLLAKFNCIALCQRVRGVHQQDLPLHMGGSQLSIAVSCSASQSFLVAPPPAF